MSHPFSCRVAQDRVDDLVCGARRGNGSCRRQDVHQIEAAAPQGCRHGHSEGVLARKRAADAGKTRAVPVPMECRTILEAHRRLTLRAGDDVYLMARVGQVPDEVVEIPLASSPDLGPAEGMDEGDAKGSHPRDDQPELPLSQWPPCPRRSPPPWWS